MCVVLNRTHSIYSSICEKSTFSPVLRTSTQPLMRALLFFLLGSGTALMLQSTRHMPFFFFRSESRGPSNEILGTRTCKCPPPPFRGPPVIIDESSLRIPYAPCSHGIRYTPSSNPHRRRSRGRGSMEGSEKMTKEVRNVEHSYSDGYHIEYQRIISVSRRNIRMLLTPSFAIFFGLTCYISRTRWYNSLKLKPPPLFNPHLHIPIHHIVVRLSYPSYLYEITVLISSMIRYLK